MSQRGLMGLVRGWMTMSVLAVGLLGTATVAAARIDTLRVAPSAAPLATASAAPARVTAAAPAPRQAAETTAPATASAEPGPAPAATPVRTLRRLRGDEVNAELVRHASRIVREHHHEPFGTEIPFEVDGRAYVGRIERHYHPEGGPLKPWGFHPGCSLFAVEQR